ncbi:MAG: hypothetical protein DRJ50_14585 [Actinobacteria bacterium]|nr:MAG: hypothetical protein DRJ50_14585 [Actinomycetota bacterium]
MAYRSRRDLLASAPFILEYERAGVSWTSTVSNVTSATEATDTHGEVLWLMVDRWRGMTALEKLEQVEQLNRSCDQLAAAGARVRHPEAPEHEVMLRVMALRLGREHMITVFGWDPARQGW